MMENMINVAVREDAPLWEDMFTSLLDRHEDRKFRAIISMAVELVFEMAQEKGYMFTKATSNYWTGE